MDTTNRYRKAFQAGRDGRPLPSGLAELADSDPKIDEAYQAGQNGEEFADPSAPSNPPPSTAVRARPSTGPSSAGKTVKTIRATGGSILLGLFATAMVISIIDHGPKGPLIWFKAKFLNEVPGRPNAPSNNLDHPLTVAPGPFNVNPVPQASVPAPGQYSYA